MIIETIPSDGPTRPYDRLKFLFTIDEMPEAFQFYLREGKRIGRVFPGLPGQGCAFVDLRPGSNLEATADGLRLLYSQQQEGDVNQ